MSSSKEITRIDNLNYLINTDDDIYIKIINFVSWFFFGKHNSDGALKRTNRTRKYVYSRAMSYIILNEIENISDVMIYENTEITKSMISHYRSNKDMLMNDGTFRSMYNDYLTYKNVCDESYILVNDVIYIVLAMVNNKYLCVRKSKYEKGKKYESYEMLDRKEVSKNGLKKILIKAMTKE